MPQFREGEQVLVRRLMGQDCTPVRPGTIKKVYGQSSLLYGYLVRVGTHVYPVRDDWLVTGEYTIQEDLDLTEL